MANQASVRPVDGAAGLSTHERGNLFADLHALASDS
jgi:hypothetical protein